MDTPTPNPALELALGRTGSASSPDRSVDVDVEVLVIGAGLAGLQCARTLSRAGVDVQVWEAADAVGGRIRTDHVDGFLLDRGFQVLNPAYPAVRRHIDVEALRLGSFGSGVRVRREDRLATVADPLREPAHLRDLLTSGYLRPSDVVALSRWAAPALVSPRRIINGPDRSNAKVMDDAGLTGPARDLVLGFLTGVVLEDDGSTSAAFVRLLLRMFALGSPGVPDAGMQALPQQIAKDLPVPVRTGTLVTSIEHGSTSAVVHADGVRATARLVVVATGASAAESLLGVPAPAMKGVVTDWFTMPEAPEGKFLTIDGRGPGQGPVKNTAVLTAAAPSYAPVGRHLVQASSLLRGGQAPDVSEVLRHVGQIHGRSTTAWELVRRHEIPQALPVQLPPLRTRRSMRISDSVIMAGDHMDTASIQGALVSGERAARGWLLKR